MTTLILGCGYLGLAVARHLRDLDSSSIVIGTTRSAARSPEIAGAGAEPHIADLLDRDSIAGLPDADAIIHCAAYGRTPDRPSLAIGGILAELAGRGWDGRLVHVSTTSVYGQTNGSWVHEGSRAKPTTDAGRGALAAEALLRSARPSAVTIRMAGLYGPGRIIGRAGLLRGEPVAGEPERWLNLIRIEDAARVVAAALTHGEPAPLYLACDDRPLTRGGYYSILARLMRLPPPPFAVRAGAEAEPSKRVRNRLMRDGLGIRPDFADVVAGLRGLL